AARIAPPQEGPGVEDLLVRLALDPAEVPARQHEVRPEAAAPLKRAAHRGARHPLIEGERLGVAVRRLGGEGARELLKIPVQAEAPVAAVPGAEPSPRREGAGLGVVVLQRRAVAAILVVMVSAQ